VHAHTTYRRGVPRTRPIDGGYGTMDTRMADTGAVRRGGGGGRRPGTRGPPGRRGPLRTLCRSFGFGPTGLSRGHNLGLRELGLGKCLIYSTCVGAATGPGAALGRVGTLPGGGGVCGGGAGAGGGVGAAGGILGCGTAGCKAGKARGQSAPPMPGRGHRTQKTLRTENRGTQRMHISHTLRYPPRPDRLLRTPRRARGQ